MVRRTALVALALAGIALSGTALSQSSPSVALPFDLEHLTDEQRAIFRAEVRAFLMENPEVIMEAVRVLEERREAEAAVADVGLVDRHRESLLADPLSWESQPIDGAALTIVEFSDYRCPYCKRAHPVVARLLEEQPDIRLVIKEYPILGPDSVVAGRMAMAAHALDPSRYKALNDALMDHRGPLTEAAAYRIANEVGYDIGALKARAQADDIRDQVAANHQLARDLEINGTPAFVVGRKILRGFLPYDDMLAVLEEERAAASN